MNSDKKRIIDRYNKRLDIYGDKIESLASGNQLRREIRFNILNDVGNLKNKKIIDLGCGFGDLIPYLDNKLGANNYEYVGVDINDRILEISKSKYPEKKFLCQDILSNDFNEIADYVISTSTFNNKLIDESNYSFIKKILNKCYSISNCGVAVDFMTSYVDYKIDDDVFYYKPEEIFKISKSITKRVTLRHDYKLFDFCIYLYKDFDGWG